MKVTDSRFAAAVLVTALAAPSTRAQAPTNVTTPDKVQTWRPSEVELVR